MRGATLCGMPHTYIHICCNVNYNIVAADICMQRHDGEHLAVHVREVGCSSKSCMQSAANKCACMCGYLHVNSNLLHNLW